jgi:hypothetical protein
MLQRCTVLRSGTPVRSPSPLLRLLRLLAVAPSLQPTPLSLALCSCVSLLFLPCCAGSVCPPRPTLALSHFPPPSAASCLPTSPFIVTPSTPSPDQPCPFPSPSAHPMAGFAPSLRWALPSGFWASPLLFLRLVSTSPHAPAEQAPWPHSPLPALPCPSELAPISGHNYCLKSGQVFQGIFFQSFYRLSNI